MQFLCKSVLDTAFRRHYIASHLHSASNIYAIPMQRPAYHIHGNSHQIYSLPLRFRAVFSHSIAIQGNSNAVPIDSRQCQSNSAPSHLAALPFPRFSELSNSMPLLITTISNASNAPHVNSIPHMAFAVPFQTLQCHSVTCLSFTHPSPNGTFRYQSTTYP